MTPWRAIRSLALIGLVVGLPGYALAQVRSGVGVVTTLVGEATVARAAMAQPQNLRMRDNVFPLDRISTKEHSTVHVLMGGKALLTVRELSVVSVTEEGGRATVDLQSGKIGLAVVRERMRPGDLIEVQTPHAVAAVRGTVLVVEIVPGSAAGDQPHSSASSTNVHLLHGTLDVWLRSDPGLAPVRLESLQTVTVSSDVLGTMRPLDPAAAAAATTGLRPGRRAVTAIPDKLLTRVGERQAMVALETAAALARGGQSREAIKGRGGKTAATAMVKASDSGSNRDAIVPVADVGDGASPAVGSVRGSIDGTVGDPGTAVGIDGGSGSGNSAVGLSNNSPGSIFGGGKGPSLSSGGNVVGTVLTPVQALPLLNKKKP